uniref:Uncharacterized protein n=1 Tax=Lygus hesperus TaxID=30085 RepID=A0A146MCW4_LYGHE
MAAHMNVLAALLILVAAQLTTFLIVEGRSKEIGMMDKGSVLESVDINDRVTKASKGLKLEDVAVEIGKKMEEAKDEIAKRMKEGVDKAAGEINGALNQVGGKTRTAVADI